MSLVHFLDDPTSLQLAGYRLFCTIPHLRVDRTHFLSNGFVFLLFGWGVSERMRRSQWNSESEDGRGKTKRRNH